MVIKELEETIAVKERQVEISKECIKEINQTSRNVEKMQKIFYSCQNWVSDDFLKIDSKFFPELSKLLDSLDRETENLKNEKIELKKLKNALKAMQK